MNLYISDLHLGHANVIGFDHRPFSDVEEMDTTMIKLWNDRVQPDDNVYIIGDFCYRSGHAPEWYLRQMKGYKYLIQGNHDGVIMKSAKAKSYFEKIDKMMHVTDQYEGRAQQICLCHYPMIEWYKSFRGTWLIYGHIHNRKAQTYEIMRNIDRALNAGAALNNYTPCSFRELVENNRRFQQED